MTLQLPEQRLLSSVVAHRGPKSLTRAAADLDLVAAFSAALAGWCSALEGLLADSELGGKDAEDAGECCCCCCRWESAEAQCVQAAAAASGQQLTKACLLVSCTAPRRP